MKQILLILALFVYSMVLSAQSESSQYLFDEFQETLILYKDGRQFTAPVNFDLKAGCFLFIDAKDNQPKQFAYPEQVALLKIGKRTFLFGKDEAVEVIQANPEFKVHYSGKLRKAPKKTSYGGTTQTAAVDSYSSLSGSGLISGMQTNDRVVTGIDKTYEVKVGRRTKTFYHMNSFLKIVPKEKRETIRKYIYEKDVDFDSIQQVLDLYLYTLKGK